MPGPSVRPVFVLSLPRSGSTVLQRVLAAHPGVSTAPEPWILLPQLYALRSRGVDAEYDHRIMSSAVNGFAARLPEGQDSYRRHLREFMLSLYADAASEDARWFIDKTPRYHLVVDELAELFPDAPLVFLWRNPLAVIASMANSWDQGKWFPCRHGIDLFTGMQQLMAAADRLRDRAISVRYEDLVTDRSAWDQVFARLGIDFEPDRTETISEIRSRFGDPTQDRYAGLSSSSLDKWQDVLATPVRARWCERYLDWLGSDRLARIGYDHAGLRAALGDLDTNAAAGVKDVFLGLRERLQVGGRRWRGAGPIHREWPASCWPTTGRAPRWRRDPLVEARSQSTDW